MQSPEKNSDFRPAPKISLFLGLALAIFLTLAFLGIVSAYLWSSYQTSKEIQAKTFEAQELNCQIKHLDEILTMSTHMAVAKGDLEWEKRYRKFKPQLDQTISQLYRTIPEKEITSAIAQVDQANKKLLAMENEALDWVRKKRSFFFLIFIILFVPVLFASWLTFFFKFRRNVYERTKNSEKLKKLIQAGGLHLKTLNEELQVEVRQRKQVEEALREAVEKFDLAVQGSNEGLWDTQISEDALHPHEEHEVWFSPRFKEILGYEDCEFENKWRAFLDHIHPEDLSRTMEEVRKHLEEKLPYDVEYRLRTKKGEYRWFRARGQAIWNEEGRPVRMAGSLRDITQERKIAEALRQSEERHRQLAENIREVFWMTNPRKNEMIYISPAYEKIWQRTCESLYQEPKSWIEAIHPDDRDRILKAAHEKQTLGTYDEEYRIQRPDGKIRWIRDRAFPIKNPAGEIYRICGVAEDITSVKDAQKAHQNLEEQLRHTQKMEAIGTLASGIAHDFNNMLAGIMGNTDLLKIYSKAGDEIFESAEAIENAADRAARLTQQLLQFARKGKQKNISVHMGDTIQEVLNLLKRTLNKNIIISSASNHPKVFVEGDPNQLQQMILNLIVNARDAMPGGGKINIENKVIYLDPSSAEKLNLSPGEYLKISIADNGPGIPENIRDRIFEPFFTTKGPSEGTGMGLAIVYSSVHNHGGAIRLKSNLGEGSQFDIYLPVSQGLIQEEKAPSKFPLQTGTGCILFIDDEEIVRDTAKKLLNQLGYDVVTASDGQAGIRSYEKQKKDIDLVIIDMVMPQINGTQCVRELKKTNPRVKVILTTGYDFSDEIRKYQIEEDIGFIQKPFKINQLSEVVAKALHP